MEAKAEQFSATTWGQRNLQMKNTLLFYSEKKKIITFCRMPQTQILVQMSIIYKSIYVDDDVLLLSSSALLQRLSTRWVD